MFILAVSALGESQQAAAIAIGLVQQLKCLPDALETDSKHANPLEFYQTAPCASGMCTSEGQAQHQIMVRDSH